MNALEVFGHWSHVRLGLVKALSLLDDDQLGFVPREGLWSLGKVALHIAEAEEGWFRHLVQGSLAAWPEFPPGDYPTVAAIQGLLEEVHTRTETWLGAMDAVDLDRVVDFPWGASASVRWAVWHVLEHEIHHRGEIYLMLGLMGMEAPDV